MFAVGDVVQFKDQPVGADDRFVIFRVRLAETEIETKYDIHSININHTYAYVSERILVLCPDQQTQFYK